MFCTAYLSAGFQRGDGVFGPLIVRVPPKINWHKDLYDHDEYTLVVTDWIHELGTSKFLAHYHADGNNKAPNLLVNGLGRTTIKNETLANMPITTFIVKPVKFQEKVFVIYCKKGLLISVKYFNAVLLRSLSS